MISSAELLHGTEEPICRRVITSTLTKVDLRSQFGPADDQHPFIRRRNTVIDEMIGADHVLHHRMAAILND